MIIAAAAVLCFFYFRTEDPAEVARDTLNDPDFLKDKEALLYFSTAADQDTFGGGKSYALFADEKGRLSSYQMKGLELGSAKVHDESVLLEDKKESTPFRTAFTRIKERTSIRETARDISNGRKALHAV